MARYTMLLKRDKKSGRYIFRLQVPDPLRPILGWELSRSLRTTDLREAKLRYPAALEWAQRSLAEARHSLQARQEEVSQEALEAAYEQSVTPEWRQLDYALRHGGRGDPSREPADLSDDAPQWREPFRSTPLAKLLRIDHPSDLPPDGGQLSPQKASLAAEQQVSLRAVFDAWLLERRPPDRTSYEWRRTCDTLARFMGHREASELPVAVIDRAQLVAWKTAMLAEGLSGKTVLNKVNVLAALLQYGLDNVLLPGATTNPARGIRVAAKADPAARRQPFSEADVQAILKAARRETLPSRRWLPWCLIFTGARMSEACQATAGDFFEHPAAGWCWRIHAGDPGEGRRLKTLGSERTIPLHRQLIAEGFLEHVQQRRLEGGEKASLWPELSVDRFGSLGGSASKLLGRWLRNVAGIKDRRLVWHSARHRMKAVARSAMVPIEAHDAITGHSTPGVGASYGRGHFDLASLRRAVDMLPDVSLEEQR